MIIIRPYQSKDRQGVIEVLYRTGYMGEHAKDYFDDKANDYNEGEKDE